MSGGLHGVGVSVVNALSERLLIEIDRDGRRYQQEYAKGGMPQGALADVGPSPADGRINGTTVTFWPDPTIFVAEGTEFVARTVLERLQTMAFLNRGLEIAFEDLREGPRAAGDVPVQGRHRRLREAPERGEGSAVRQGRHYEDEDDEGGQTLDIAIQWNTGYHEASTATRTASPPSKAACTSRDSRTALTATVNKYARTKNLLKEKDENLLGEDIREGITAIVAVKLREPQFEGQTKAKLGNVPMRSFVQKATNERLAEWLEENPAEGNRLVKKAQAAAQARLAAKNARNAIRRKTALAGAGMPDKLKDCSSGNPDESELFIVEGDSAGGSALNARDPRTQALLPIRGKILNVERARLDKMLKNNEVQSLITAIGGGVGDEFDATKARYHKIILLADADVDGSHIRTLLLTFLLPTDASPGRGRVRVHRSAAAVLHRGRQGEDLPEGRGRQGGVAGSAPQPQARVPAVEGSGRDGLGRAQAHHHGCRHAHPAAGRGRTGGHRRRDDERAHGRRRRPAQELHRDQRP